MTNRINQLREHFPVVVVVGARQVGKSTLLKEVYGTQFEHIVFDPILDIQNARQEPDLFLDNHTTPIILDEIQYVPELISAIKRRIDLDRKPGQFILTGSQQWGILNTMSESLAGRAAFIHLDGFSLSEISKENIQEPWLSRWLDDPKTYVKETPKRTSLPFPLYEQLWRGWMPETTHLPLELIPDFHHSYQRTYIERDARMIANVSDWQLFGRFLQLLSALTCQEINHSKLGRELGLTPQTTRRWLDTLKATFQWYEIPHYSGNTIKRVSQKPKGIFSDTGFACALLAITSPTAIGGHPLWGALFETAVAAELRKQCSFLPYKVNAYHWRSHGGAEVDFLLVKDGIFFPIEVKASSHPGKNDARGIHAFRQTYPNLHIEKGIVLAPVKQAFPLSDQVHVMPWDVT